MRRFFMGIVWFFVFQFVLGFFGGFLCAVLRPGSTQEQSMQVYSKFAPLIFILALLCAVLGTIKGILPGTKK